MHVQRSQLNFALKAVSQLGDRQLAQQFFHLPRPPRQESADNRQHNNETGAGRKPPAFAFGQHTFSVADLENDALVLFEKFCVGGFGGFGQGERGVDVLADGGQADGFAAGLVAKF